MAIDKKEVLTGTEALIKLRELLKEFPIAFMVTVSNGDVSARPIGIVGDDDFEGTLWFITDKRSRKVKAIESGATTTLLFQNDKVGNYLQLTGRGHGCGRSREACRALHNTAADVVSEKGSMIQTSRCCGLMQTAAASGIHTTVISGWQSRSRSRLRPASLARAATPGSPASKRTFTSQSSPSVYSPLATCNCLALRECNAE